MLWKLPFSKWGDYFALRKAKRKMVAALSSKKTTYGIAKLAPMFIKAVQKGHLMTMDYLQAYGDSLLDYFVERHFRRKYGPASKQWAEFTSQSKESGKLWEDVIALRLERRKKFLTDKVMTMKQIPQFAKDEFVQGYTHQHLLQALVAYFHYKDGEDARGRKMPHGMAPLPTPLITLENMSKLVNEKTEKQQPEQKKKPLPPQFYENNRG